LNFGYYIMRCWILFKSVLASFFLHHTTVGREGDILLPICRGDILDYPLLTTHGAGVLHYGSLCDLHWYHSGGRSCYHWMVTKVLIQKDSPLQLEDVENLGSLLGFCWWRWEWFFFHSGRLGQLLFKCFLSC
jgi:hypothetical protein